MVSVCVISGGIFIFFFILVFYILWALLIKQLPHLCLWDMRWLYPTRCYMPHGLSIISYPMCAHGISVIIIWLQKYVHSDWLLSGHYFLVMTGHYEIFSRLDGSFEF